MLEMTTLSAFAQIQVAEHIVEHSMESCSWNTHSFFCDALFATQSFKNPHKQK